MQAFFPQTGVVKQQPERDASSTQVEPSLSSTVRVQQVQSRSDLTVDEADWGWQELRDYVVSQIIAVSGPFPRDAKKEFGIFSRFIKDHGPRGVVVAKAAFEVYGGWWSGAPISINRFAKGSDPYFVHPILQRLDAS